MSSPSAPESGFSLLEMMVTLGISLAVLALVREPLLSTLSLRKTVQDQNVWQNLENNVRWSILNDALFDSAVNANSELSDCVRADSKLCDETRYSIDLFLGPGRKSTGKFKGAGETCQSGVCPIVVEASFAGLCRGLAPCDAASSLAIDYRILVEGNLFKQGSVYRPNVIMNIADDNRACDVDRLGRSSFVHKIGPLPQNLDCREPPKLERKITGVQIGECSNVNDILLGFDGDGKLICKPYLRANP